jgi:hypothetical protein
VPGPVSPLLADGQDQPIESLDWRQAKLVAIVTDGSVPELM